jgi:hypothetical protein
VAVLTRHGIRLRAPRRAHVAAALVFCIALAALLAFRSGEGGAARPSESTARAAVTNDPVAGRHLARMGYDRVVSTPLDRQTLRVSFFDGERIVLEAAVARGGSVTALNRYEDSRARLGSEVGQRIPVLVGLLLLFLLATMRLPLARTENADVAALAAFVVPVVLLNERYVEWSVIAACVPLAYLTVRCALVGLGRPQPARGEWLFDRLSPRVARLALGGAALAFVLLSIPGGLVSDVAYASIAGATKVLDGALPYGNLAQGDLVHGDTYPLLAYLAYLPGALVAPVRDGFDNLDGALYVATGFSLISAGALGIAVRRAGGNGVRIAIAMLAFPPVMIAASSGSNDVVAAALVAVALALGSTAALTAAGWVKLAPLALVPVWVAAARRRGRALIGAVAVTAASAVVLVMLGGLGGLADMVDAVSFQAERGSLLSPWSVLDAGGAQVVFQAAVIAAIAGACLRVWSDRALAADPRRMAALGAAILLAVQLAANYWSYTYLAWAFPLIAVALLTPSRPSAPSGSRPAARP